MEPASAFSSISLHTINNLRNTQVKDPVPVSQLQLGWQQGSVDVASTPVFTTTSTISQNLPEIIICQGKQTPGHNANAACRGSTSLCRCKAFVLSQLYRCLNTNLQSDVRTLSIDGRYLPYIFQDHFTCSHKTKHFITICLSIACVCSVSKCNIIYVAIGSCIKICKP